MIVDEIKNTSAGIQLAICVSFGNWELEIKDNIMYTASCSGITMDGVFEKLTRCFSFT
jgi:hypothetical protein